MFAQFYPKTTDNSLPDGWEYKTIEQLNCLITDYVANGSFQSLADNVEYQEEDTGNVLIRLTDNNSNYTGKFVFITDEAYEFLSKSKLYGGEIIIANVGVNVGTTFRCPTLDYKMSLAQNAIMIRDELYQEYLYAFFRCSIGQRALQELVTGSAQPKFNKTSLRKLRIAFPNNHESLSRFMDLVKRFYRIQEENNQEIRSLYKLQTILLQELSR